MILQSLRHAGWPALLACTAVAACSKTAAIEDAFVSASVGGTGTLCNLGASEPVLSIGIRGTQPSTVPSGTGDVTVDCSVSPNGGGFDIVLGASGDGEGKLVVRGHVDATTGGTVYAAFASTTTGGFEAQDCTLTYTYAGLAVPQNPPISAGEIFGHVDCPNAMSQTGASVGSSTVTCDASADFLFENCTD